MPAGKFTVALCVALALAALLCLQAQLAEAQCEHHEPGYGACTWCCTYHDSHMVWDMDTSTKECHCMENPANPRGHQGRVGWFW